AELEAGGIYRRAELLAVSVADAFPRPSLRRVDACIPAEPVARFPRGAVVLLPDRAPVQPSAPAAAARQRAARHRAGAARMPHGDEPAAMSRTQAVAGLLGDTPQRDYTEKLRLFNAFARPELREAIAALAMLADARVLDAGCGTGEAVGWFHDSAGDRALVVGMDLATAHVHAARHSAPAPA